MPRPRVRCIVHSLRLLQMEELIRIVRCDDLCKVRVGVDDPAQVQVCSGQHHAGRRRRCAKRALIQLLQLIGDHLHFFEFGLYDVDGLQAIEHLCPLGIVTDRVA